MKKAHTAFRKVLAAQAAMKYGGSGEWTFRDLGRVVTAYQQKHRTVFMSSRKARVDKNKNTLSIG